MTKSYTEQFEERGLSVPGELARKYRHLLLEDAIVMPYLKARLSGPTPDHEWMMKVSEGSAARNQLAAESGDSEEEVVAGMVSEAENVFAQTNESAQLTALAHWYERWIGTKGLKSLRNTINSKRFSQRSKKQPISLYEDTFNRNKRLLDLTPEASSFDDLQNILISSYIDTHGIELDLPSVK